MWVDIVAASILPEIMLEVQSWIISVGWGILNSLREDSNLEDDT